MFFQHSQTQHAWENRNSVLFVSKISTVYLEESFSWDQSAGSDTVLVPEGKFFSTFIPSKQWTHIPNAMGYHMLEHPGSSWGLDALLVGTSAVDVEGRKKTTLTYSYWSTALNRWPFCHKSTSLTLPNRQGFVTLTWPRGSVKIPCPVEQGLCSTAGQLGSDLLISGQEPKGDLSLIHSIFPTLWWTWALWHAQHEVCPGFSRGDLSWENRASGQGFSPMPCLVSGVRSLILAFFVKC